MKRVRFSLRTKLALVALVLLALPWAGAMYVNEVERFLLEGQEQTLLATTRAVATALHERPHLLAAAPAREDAEVAAILAGVERSSSRIWVVNHNLQVLARAGTLKRPAETASEAPWWQPLAGWLVQRPTEDFAEARPEDILTGGGDVGAALQGTPATRTRRTEDGRAVVMSAAHPIWSGDEVVGAVVRSEEHTSELQSQSNLVCRLLLEKK